MPLPSDATSTECTLAVPPRSSDQVAIASVFQSDASSGLPRSYRALATLLTSSPDSRLWLRTEIISLFADTIADRKLLHFSRDDIKNVQAVRKNYQKKASDRFIYEDILSIEVMLIASTRLTKILKDEFEEAMSSGKTNAMDKIDIYNKSVRDENGVRQAMYSLVEQNIILLWKGNVDVCARMTGWDFSNRLVGGGPYYPRGGIEAIDDFVTMLREAYKNETGDRVRNIATEVIAKMKAKGP